MKKEEILKRIEMEIKRIDDIMIYYDNGDYSYEFRKLLENKSFLSKLYVNVDNNEGIFMLDDGTIILELGNKTFKTDFEYCDYSVDVVRYLPNWKFICCLSGNLLYKFVLED